MQHIVKHSLGITFFSNHRDSAEPLTANNAYELTTFCSRDMILSVDDRRPTIPTSRQSVMHGLPFSARLESNTLYIHTNQLALAALWYYLSISLTSYPSNQTKLHTDRLIGSHLDVRYLDITDCEIGVLTYGSFTSSKPITVRTADSYIDAIGQIDLVYLTRDGGRPADEYKNIFLRCPEARSMTIHHDGSALIDLMWFLPDPEAKSDLKVTVYSDHEVNNQLDIPVIVRPTSESPYKK